MAASSQRLRELMKKQRAETSKTAKKIASPLAKYNNIGQLFCVACNSQVKSELVWPAHVQSRKHKENITLLKSQPNVAHASSSRQNLVVEKRKADSTSGHHEHVDKKPKVSAGSNGGQNPSTQATSSSGIPEDFFDRGAPSASGSVPIREQPKETTHPAAPDQSLPPGFFDNSEKKESATEDGTGDARAAAEPEAEAEPSELPEGFFDDPKMDAKVRHVEPKDTMNEEWEKFQKSIAEEAGVSEAMVEEEEEVRWKHREIEDVDEQIDCLSRVEKLRDQMDRIHHDQDEKVPGGKGAADETPGDSEDEEEDAEAEFEEFLDWRLKKV